MIVFDEKNKTLVMENYTKPIIQQKVLIPLPLEIEGKGETKGWRYTCIVCSTKGCIYKASDGTNEHYEVFEHREANICIDFEKRIYSDTEYKLLYPKSKDFGKWAWTLTTLESAYDKLKTIQL